ncbi:Pyridoxamine 5'-phosphate oxidase [Mariniblastus fucicola]|uniref:Pyridoxamine 5'-phosphate oxidase n=2 Tax=Mariniblastus fucicola TaxID=980251 RepID=A0A5B9PGS6_9BACT|nr:Pyridoxamine 5'-phosphate oxidase [Mariniblastus fucicola]
MFFVATAPIAANGHLNLSPKGLNSFLILDEHTVAYADLIGSGIETVAHLKENGRIVLMFCAFEGAPNIVRFHGTGEVVEPGDTEFETLSGMFPELSGLRSVIRVHCTRISDSCGFGVPLFNFQGNRDQLERWIESKSMEQRADYIREKNSASIDALPGARPD